MPPCGSSQGARSLNGSLRFRAAADSAGITRVCDVKRSAPLQLQRPLYVDPRGAGLATVNIINSTAGVFAGDALSIAVDATTGAALEMRTPTTTRVYNMDADGVATSTLRLRVGAGGYVECVPLPMLLCAGATLRQDAHVDVATGGHVALGDVWSFGRAAYGELHAYRELDARTEIYTDGSPVLVDALRLRPHEDDVEAAVAGRATYGSLTLVGPAADGAFVDVARGVLRSRGETLAGASTLPRQTGVAVRVLGDSGHAVHETLAEIVRSFRTRAMKSVEEPCGGVTWR